MFKVNFKTFAWQSMIAPLPGALVIVVIAQFWYRIIFYPLTALGGIYVSAGISILLAFICLLWVYFPLYGYFGGWDDYNIEQFNEAVRISGPSKFLFNPIVKANQLLLKKSKLHNKHTIPWEDADKEAKDLMKEAFVKEEINYIKQTIL